MCAAGTLLTAEDYFKTPVLYERSELVQGVVVPLELPGFQHGSVCGELIYKLADFVKNHDVGWSLAGSGIITRRNPDTVRGCDACFYSYERIGRGESPIGYPQAAPNVVFEVRSPTDRWSEIHEKIGEYLSASVELVCVLISEAEEAHLFYPDRPVEILRREDRLSLPAPLDAFDQPVSEFFRT